MTSTYLYDNRGNLTDLYQTTGGQPSTEIIRAYDGYSQLTDEQAYIGGLLSREVAQNWDAAGRRKEMNCDPAFPQGAGDGHDITYGYRADGLMTSLNPGGLGYSISYGDNGLMTSRFQSVPHRNNFFARRHGPHIVGQRYCRRKHAIAGNHDVEAGRQVADLLRRGTRFHRCAHLPLQLQSDESADQ